MPTNKKGSGAGKHAAAPNANVNPAAYSRNNSAYQFRASQERANKKHKKHTKIAIVVVLLLVAILGVGGFSGYSLYSSAKSLKAEASTIMTNVDTIKSGVKSGDYDGAANAAKDIQAKAKSMQQELDSPLWSAATAVPTYGEDVKSVKELASILADVSDGALVPLASALQENPVNNMIKEDGSIDVGMVNTLLNKVTEAAPAMQNAEDRLNALPEMHLEQLQKMIDPAKTKFSEINALFQQGASIAPIMGTLLGVNGDRNYMIAAQNSAEIRSTGGFPGAVGNISISNGKIEMGEFGTPYDLMLDETALITEEELRLFNDTQFDITVPRDAGIIPDYTQVANVWAQAYNGANGANVDGVVSVTPSVVQDLLKVAGEITLSDGTVLNGDNATRVLESDLYWDYLSTYTKYPGNDDYCDALFAEAANLAFQKAMGSLNAKSLMALAKAFFEDFENGTFMIWLTNPDEQAQLSVLNCSGDLNNNETEPLTAIYIGEIRGSKMGWYLDAVTSVSAGTKNSDGTTSYTLTINLSNALRNDEVDSAGAYIAGQAGGYVDPRIYLLAPAGGSISNVTSSNNYEFREDTYQGLQMFTFTNIDLAPEETQIITYTVTVSANATQELALHETPTLTKYRTA